MNILIDDRERTPLILPLPPGATTTTRRLKTGDYSVEGFEDRIAVERKKSVELYQTTGTGRTRFIHELQRMREIIGRGGVAAIVVEGSLHQIVELGHSGGRFGRSAIQGKSVKAAHVIGSIVAWSVSFGVPVWFAGRLDLAGELVMRLLLAGVDKVRRGK